MIVAIGFERLGMKGCDGVLIVILQAVLYGKTLGVSFVSIEELAQTS